MSERSKKAVIHTRRGKKLKHKISVHILMCHSIYMNFFFFLLLTFKHSCFHPKKGTLLDFLNFCICNLILMSPTRVSQSLLDLPFAYWYSFHCIIFLTFNVCSITQHCQACFLYPDPFGKSPIIFSFFCIRYPSYHWTSCL